ncbi:MAG TPA: N-acetylmuramoyl-L-alanine amidase [Acidimicrobiia bacterium]
MPDIVTRAEWGSNYPVAGHRISGAVGEVIIHHYWRPHIDAAVTAASERRTVRGVEKHHNDNIQSGGGTGYNFNVFQSSRAYEGRGWFRTGAHAAGRNSKSVGIALAIDGDAHVPTDGAWATVRDIIAEGVRVGAISPNHVISGHTDYSTKTCPGTKTYPLIQTKLQQEDDMEEVPQPSWLGKEVIDRLLAAGVLTSRPSREPVVVWRMYAFLDRAVRASSGGSSDGLKRGDTVTLR